MKRIRRCLWKKKMPAAGKRKYMEVLKEKFAAFKGNMKNTFVCFPVTQGSIWLFTLLFVLLININDSSVMDFLEGSCSFWFSMARQLFHGSPVPEMQEAVAAHCPLYRVCYSGSSFCMAGYAGLRQYVFGLGV